MSNLLLITDVARLRKIFGRLAEDKNIRLRIVNNLEKGGEEIAIEKPDVVFVQTHLSGLSADILLMHLKKQLGRRRSRFVLLASATQTSAAVLKSYQGWLDISADDSQLLSELNQLLATLLGKSKKEEGPSLVVPETTPDITAQPVTGAESVALLGTPSDPAPAPALQIFTEPQQPAAASVEPSLEEQGITYAPRQRLKVYSEFNSSFDNAVSSTQEPEPLVQAAPLSARDWSAETVDTAETRPVRSRSGTFLLWLVPVVAAVILITYLQQRRSAPKDVPATATSAPVEVNKSPTATPASGTPAVVQIKDHAATATIPPVSAREQERQSDKEVLTAIAENRGPKAPAASAGPAARPTELPDFIPRAGIDKQFSVANPGWERYKGRVTEFKVFRENQAIKAIQVIDRGGEGVPESFMKGVLRQVAKTPIIKIETAEKKEGYEIQRGRIADNIQIVYYRDESGGKLRAFVMTWK